MRKSSHRLWPGKVIKRMGPLSIFVVAGIAEADNIDEYVRAEMERLQIPAVAFAIVKNGQVVRKQAIGFADVGTGRQAKTGDLYEIGSLTKQFTSTGIMMLVESGRINLEDSITKVLNNAPAAWKSIKVKNLLYQTSGLHEYIYQPGLGLLDNFSRPQFMEAVRRLPLDYAPGAGWTYSNTNYALLGWIIEDVTKEPYAKFIEETILRPLGMTHSTFSERGIDVRGIARGYVLRRRVRVQAPRGAASVKADGAMISNLDDLIKWDGALSEFKLLSRKSYQTVWSRAKLNSGRAHSYGMGWYLNQPGSKDYMGHSGQSAGYSAGISRFPGAHISVILLANMYGVGGEAISKRIAALYDPRLRNPAFVASHDPDPRRTERVKLAIQAIAANSLDESLLDSEFIIQLRARRNQLAALPPWGRLKVVDLMEFGGARPEGKDTVITYRVGSGPNRFVVSALWTTEDKLAQATIEPYEAPASQPAGKG